jgi:hypothetical protein
LVTDAVLRDYPQLAPYDIYLSGPPVMVQAGHGLFLNHGLDESRFFSDAFEYAAVAEYGLATMAISADGESVTRFGLLRWVIPGALRRKSRYVQTVYKGCRLERKSIHAACRSAATFWHAA